ncbi:amidohydrolase [Yoonia sp. F2084L]|uniref:amidohydrolase family protein n=1 Tax=Yoonia sp. F2084L TaxID=2926419 RepID=UPI001FF48854|nr:amidohydrolase family protein [Yoonia sp. F2084L]MCK0097140.1 amidohydrolase [Yoonia sp. F2084L]
MFSRRYFLLSSVATFGPALAGCSPFEPETPPPENLPPFSIDIHAHIFNATDIPVPGFLNQVFLRSPESPVTGNYVVEALIRLLTDILLLAVSTADEELGRLPNAGAIPQTNERNLLDQDKRLVAEGIRNFAQGEQSLRAVRDDREAREDAQLLDELANLANRGLLARRSSPDLGQAVAEAIFDEPTNRIAALRVAGGDFDLAQSLRWAALLTRDRRDILGELIRLYGPRQVTEDGKPIGIQVFSPSLVDFDYWFKNPPQDRFSKIADQINILSRLAQLEQRAVLLNFAPFCPLRAAVDGIGVHRVIRDAVLNKGFVGVKMYPPMGFKPIGNEETTVMGHRFQASGAAVDRELRRMYEWCQANGVPIKSHGNNSLAAQECSGQNAAPDLWDRVLTNYPDLRVNIAHFGGFEEQTDLDDQNDRAECADDPPTYEKRAADLIAAHENAYVDLGYWTEVAGRNAPGQDVLDKINALLADNERLGRRIMYGSDYTMIGRERQHGAYLNDIKTAIGSLNGIDESQIFSANAQSYLQLNDPESGTRERLRRFFPEGHKYFDLVGEI